MAQLKIPQHLVLALASMSLLRLTGFRPMEHFIHIEGFLDKFLLCAEEVDRLLGYHRKGQSFRMILYLFVCVPMLLIKIVPGLVTVSRHFHTCIVSVIKRLLL